MPVAVSRADHQAHKDEIARLREQVAALERELRRARRCLAAERLGQSSSGPARAEEGLYALSVTWLCRLAFPGTNHEFVQSNECEGSET